MQLLNLFNPGQRPDIIHMEIFILKLKANSINYTCMYSLQKTRQTIHCQITVLQRHKDVIDLNAKNQTNHYSLFLINASTLYFTY